MITLHIRQRTIKHILKCTLITDPTIHIKVLFSSFPTVNWVTFDSHLYPGRISDREIVEKIDFCSLVEPGDEFLVNKGINVRDLMAWKGASLHIPPKRQSVQDQFTKEECFETMSIANVGIRVERTIKLVKAWHMFDQVVPLSMHGFINQLWTVASLIVNFQNPILSV